MKFKFSIRRLLLVTTITAVILAVCERLNFFRESNMLVVAIGIYCVTYFGLISIFLAPRYWREWNAYQTRANDLKAARHELEKEVEQKRAELDEEIARRDQ
jgi:hypothetical protein